VVPPAGQPDEHDLLVRLAAGDEHALAELYDRHAAVVYGTARALVADADEAADVTERVFVEVWTRAHHYVGSGIPLGRLLTGLAHHHAVRLTRSRRGRGTTTLTGLPDAGRLPWS
jgi:RNA polymerase sigma-70 factor, ECF subfamily